MHSPVRFNAVIRRDGRGRDPCRENGKFFRIRLSVQGRAARRRDALPHNLCSCPYVDVSRGIRGSAGKSREGPGYLQKNQESRIREFS